jgi:hypothetical protein
MLVMIACAGENRCQASENAQLIRANQSMHGTYQIDVLA